MSKKPAWLNEPALQEFFTATKTAGGEARAVGGCVRDWLMGRDGADVDVASTLLPEQTMALAQQHGWKAIPTGIAHGTVTLVLPTRILEVTTLRRDVETDGRRATVAFTDDWREDASRRDFTINAMSMDAKGVVTDFFDGRDDLEAHRVRFIGDAAQRIEEDGLRMLRYFRFLATHGKPPADTTALAAIAQHKAMIAQLSGERVANEMKKLLAAENPAYALRLMKDAGLAPLVFGREIEPSTIIRLQLLEGQADYQTSVWARALALLNLNSPLEGELNRSGDSVGGAECVSTIAPSGEALPPTNVRRAHPTPPQVGSWEFIAQRWKLSRHETKQLTLLAGLMEPSTCKGEGRVGVQFRQHSQQTIDYARALRVNATDVEKILWKKLSRRQTGHHFRRQHPIGGYIADFVCTERKLVIELDGGQHASQQNYDTKRTSVIESDGYRVLRFWNHEIIENLEGVWQVIMEVLGSADSVTESDALNSPMSDPHPTLPLAGGGLNVLPRHFHTRIIRLHGAPVYLDWVLLNAATGHGVEIAPYVQLAHQFVPPVFPITAKDLIVRGMSEGKALGDALAALEQRWEESNYRLEREELLATIALE